MDGHASAVSAPLANALAAFARHGAAGRLGRATIERHGEYGFVARPPEAPGPRIDLLLMALIHGDEVGGLDVLGAVCAALADGSLAPALSIGFLLCNVEAARRGQRFIERDLNRCFGSSAAATLEDRRARAIEPMMALARHSLDLHQTVEPATTPFLVSACHEPSLRFAHLVAPQFPIVTYWGAFSDRSGPGCTSDQFIHRQGGIGFSIELGQKGFCPNQRALGVALCVQALAAVAALDAGTPLPLLCDQRNAFYNWHAVVPYPDDGAAVCLQPGLVNFQPIEQGQLMGWHGAQALRAPLAGLLLFPKYATPQQAVRPAELYRLLRRLSLPELVSACGAAPLPHPLP